MVVVDPDLQIPEPHEETHVGRDARQLSSTVLGVAAGSRNRRLKIICDLKIKISTNKYSQTTEFTFAYFTSTALGLYQISVRYSTPISEWKK